MQYFRTRRDLMDFLSGCFQDLSLNEAECVESGWDNIVLRINNNYIIRVPRREDNALQLEREIEFLRQASPFLPLPVPDYGLFCRKEGKLIAAGYRNIDGVGMEGADVPGKWNRLLPPEDWNIAQKAAKQLAAFLNSLHRIPEKFALENNGEIFTGEGRRNNVSRFYASVKREVFPLLEEENVRTVDKLFSEFLSNDGNFAYAPVTVHNDLESGNILWNPKTGEITGIIDWGDFAVSDPAVDFAGFYFEFGEAFSNEVLSFYELGNFADIKRRAMFFAKLIPLNNILFGIREGESSIRDKFLKYVKCLE